MIIKIHLYLMHPSVGILDAFKVVGNMFLKNRLVDIKFNLFYFVQYKNTKILVHRRHIIYWPTYAVVLSTLEHYVQGKLHVRDTERNHI